jgi:hypothetical protein
MLQSLIFSNFAGPILRHSATVLGGYLVASGIADEGTAEAIMGGFVAAGGLVLSWVEKEVRS